MAHILLEQAYRYREPIYDGTLEDSTFNQSKGYWVLNTTGQALMESNVPRLSTTKKCDRETGEDQKGE